MKKTKTVVIGVYNELYYYIDKIVDENPPETLFKAGNSPHESQGYLPAKDGVGLTEMKKKCEQTARDFAKEYNAVFGGLQYEDWSQEDEPNNN